MKLFFLSLSLLILGATLCVGGLWLRLEKETPALEISQFSEEAAPYPRGMEEFLDELKGIQIIHSPQKELPRDLQWERGDTEPPIGDPQALKGGQIRLCNVGPFPEHFRPFGGLSPLFFNYTLYSSIEMQLLARHPQTGKIIPALAQSWAQKGRCIYFKINPAARYSNHRPVRAQDFLLDIYLRCSPFAQDPFSLSQLQKRIERIEIYNEHTLSVTLRQDSLLAPLLASELLHAAEPSFYAEYGSDYLQRYRKRIPPTTGGYTILSDKIQRGRSITLSRVPHWWAQELPYYQYSCNVDSIEIHFLQDEAQMWEFFHNKRLDFVQSRNVSTWQQEMECADVWEGRIEKRIFKADYPLPPYGIYINSKTVPQIEMRKGIMHALDMDSAIDVLFRGEAERLHSFCEGYGAISPNNITQYPYDPQQARAYFAQCGYTKMGADGILQKEDGTRLSISYIYTPSTKTETLANILRSQALSCGLELNTQAYPWQKTSELVQSKQYQLAFWADVASSPLPQIEAFFHSRYAQAYGKNLHAIQDKALDAAIEAMNCAGNLQELTKATQAANQRIAELALWLPGWKENTAYLANWRHLRFPNTADCHFAYPSPFDLIEAHLYWIDPQYSLKGKHPEIDEHIEGKVAA